MESALPFTKIQDQLPHWRVTVDDPQAAAQARVEAGFRLLSFPQGTVLAGALRVYDQPGRPRIQHHFNLWQNPEVQAWFRALKSSGKVLLEFDRRGWNSSGLRTVEISPAVTGGILVEAAFNEPDLDGQAALQAYSGLYQSLLTRHGNPEAVWDAMEKSLGPPRRNRAAKPGGWIKWLLAAAVAGGLAFAAKKMFGAVPVLQGPSNGETAIVKVLAGPGQDLQFSAPLAGTLSAEAIPLGSLEGQGQLWQLTLGKRLEGPDEVELLVHEKGLELDRRSLLFPDLKKTRFRVAVASCMDESFEPGEGEKIWRQLGSEKPDTLFLIGDNVYVDRHKKARSGADIWMRYTEAWRGLELYRLKQLIPTYAVWDDHDFGFNDGGRDFKFLKEATKVFEAFFKVLSQPDTMEFGGGPGVSSFFWGWGQQFLFLDDRSFRAAAGDASAEAHWGPDMPFWHMEPEEPTWLINGGQFFGGYHKYESLEGSHPAAFADFKKKAADWKQPLFLISGDRHMGELMRIEKEALGYETYELTTSPIQAKTWPDSVKDPNPRRLHAAAECNYAIIDGRTEKGGMDLKVRLMGRNKKVLFKNSLLISR